MRQIIISIVIMFKEPVAEPEMALGWTRSRYASVIPSDIINQIFPAKIVHPPTQSPLFWIRL